MSYRWGWTGIVAVATHVTSSQASTLRPRFEPTDLELASPGSFGIDHQSSVTYGNRSWGRRWVASDLELNLGLLANVELDLDWAVIRDDSGTKPEWVGDPLWTSVKLGLFEWHPRGPLHAVAFGMQLGPRLPTFRSGKGCGYAALALLGLSLGRTVTVVNAGYALDPGTSVGSGRPSAFLLGLDVNHPLNARGSILLLGELGSVLYTSHDSNEYDVSLGLAWDPNDHLEFSVVVLGGQLATGDRLAILAGLSPSFDLW